MRAVARFLASICCALASASALASSCIWFADDDSIHQVQSDTNQVSLTISLLDPSRLVMSAGDCGVWAVFKHDRRLLHFDAGGAPLQDLRIGQIDPRLGDIDALQVDPFDDSLWLNDGQRVSHLSSNGQLIGGFSAPGSVRGLRVAQDQSLWLLGRHDLWHFDSQGALIAAYPLSRHLSSDARFFALDSIRGVIWLADDDELSQLQLASPTAPPFRFSFPDRTTGFALDPLKGQVWVSLPNELRTYGTDGTLIRSVDLRPLGIRNPQKLSFDPASRSLWTGAERSVARFGDDGTFIIRFPARDGDEALGVPAFKAEPTLSLVRPPQSALINNPQPTFTLSYDALCNDQACGFGNDYLGRYGLSATLNNQAVGSLFVFDPASGQASFTPASRLPEGGNSFSAQVRDPFGHASNTIVSSITVDTIPPKFLAVTPPDGSIVASSNVVIQGTIDDPTAKIVLSGVGQSPTSPAFSFPVVLNPGLNTFVLSAVDPAGNAATATVHLTLASISVSVTSPLDGATVNSDSVSVSGTFQSPDGNVGIVVNGVAAAVVGNSFVASNVPLQLGSNTLTITATTRDGQTVSRTLTITSTGPATVQVSASATQGMAPLGVQFAVTTRGSSPLQFIYVRFTATGGLFLFGPGNTIATTYGAPGVYSARFQIFDVAGNFYDITVPIAVQDPAQIDQMLRSTWSGFANALASGNAANATQYFNAQAQTKYGPVLSAIQPKLPQIAASFTAPQMSTLSNDIGEYVVGRNVNGINQVFFIYFMRDADGVWRLDSM
jgi:hypothetical protein